LSRKSSRNKIKRSYEETNNIEGAMVMYLYEKRHSPITTRFKGMGLQECDVLSISNSNYIYEYEIKISRGDFKKDFTKKKHDHVINEKFTRKKKGEIQFNVCNYFSYVVPKGLISIDEVPEYAGLIYMNDDFTFDVIKKPKLLHKTKATSSFIRKVAHNLSCKLIFNKVK
jgi:hypothetical protein